MLDGIPLLFGILLAISHLDKLIEWSLEVSYLHVFVNFRSKGIFYRGIATGVSDLDSQRKFLSIYV